MDEPERSMVEVREELMVSPTDENQNQNPCLRTAHFLKPVFGPLDNPLPKLPSQCLSSLTQSSPEPKSLPLSISFHGWRCRAKNWSTWIEKMAALHESTWKKAGIHEAIMNSTYQIKRNNDLVYGLAEKWCCDTKSFVFPWGEASVTLEDVMILGGFSVLGSPVFTPLETEELKAAEEGLRNARLEIVRSKAKKACPRLWMQKFMDTGHEFEHEAFLAFWLSRYVFTNAHETIREHVFSVAIHLARGTRLALAPAVLASIYRDLCLLKDAITAATTKLGKEEVFTLTLWSPFQLVQVWAWERFVGLRPQPNAIAKDEPRLAQWHDVSCKVDNVRLSLESAGGSFEWRPYAAQIDNWKQPKFFRENEVCISITARLDKELESFARCLKASELVGLDCVEQYLPHRVAMQFGIDQDIPGGIPPRSNDTPEHAWLNYCESLSGVKLYIPSRLYKASVTARYLKWWKQAVLESKGAAKGLKKSSKNSKGKKQGRSVSGCPGLHQKIDAFYGKTEVNNPSVSPNCSLKSSKKQGDSVKRNNSGTGSRPSFPLKKSKSVSQILEEKQVGNNDSTPSGSYRRNSRKSAEDLKGNKKPKEESSSPTSPLMSGSSKELLQTLKRKDKEEESALPGFSKKRLKKSAENSTEIKEETHVSASSRFCLRSSKNSAQFLKDKEEGSSDSASHALPSVNTKKPPQTVKRKKGNSSRVSIGFTPNLDGKEAEDSPEDNNPTIAEMMRSCKKRTNTASKDCEDDGNRDCEDDGNRDCEDDGNRSGHSQSLSSTIADDEAVKYFEPLALLAEKAMQDESMLRGAVETVDGAYKDQRELEMVQEKVQTGEPERIVEVANEGNPSGRVGKMLSINGIEGECSCYAVEIPGLSLEARISRLEKLVEELKAMRSACKD